MRFQFERFGLTLAITGILFVFPASAPAGSQSTIATDVPKLSTDKLIQQGTYSLRYGKRLETAITYFGEAAKREPQNARLKVLLACAQAQRAYTLSLALAEAPMYERRLASFRAWQEAQKDQTSPLHGKSAPVVGDPPKTEDDGKRFAMTPADAQARIKGLSLGAIDLLDTATQLAEKNEPAIRAELANLTGWALLLLWRDPRRVVPESWPQKDGKFEGPERVIAAFESAVTFAPGSDVYSQSLSDGCVLAATDPRRWPIIRPARFDAGLHSRGKDLLRQLAKRRPHQGALWFRVSSLESRTDFYSALAGPRSSESVEALQSAAKAEPSNALYAYALAAAHAGTEGDIHVIEGIENGNTGASLVPPRYRYAVPSLFAWAFPPEASTFPQLEASIVGSVERWVKAAVKENDVPRVARALKAMRGMENKFSQAKEAQGLSAAEQDYLASVAFICSDTVRNLTKTLTNDFPSIQ
ncbi:MAG: hypothetical protein V4671_31465 [Armatimonadota bacterium]